LKALFDGLVKLHISDLGDAERMISKEGEEVPFSKNVKG
jgi:hypothetical protein